MLLEQVVDQPSIIRWLGVSLITSLLFFAMAVNGKSMPQADAEEGLRLTIYAPGEFRNVGDIMQKYMVRQTDALMYQPIHADEFGNIVIVDGGYCLTCTNTVPGTKSLKQAIVDAPKYRTSIAAYNMEHWEYTPASEQADPIGSVRTAAQMAHDAGLKFMLNPDGGFLWNKDPKTGIRFYNEYDWENIDYLLIQFQSKRYAGGLAADGKDIQAFQNNVKTVVDVARSQNPNIVVFEQLSLTFDSPQTIIQKTQAISGIVDGVAYFYKEGSRCTNCTEANLMTILKALRPDI